MDEVDKTFVRCLVGVILGSMAFVVLIVIFAKKPVTYKEITYQRLDSFIGMCESYRGLAGATPNSDTGYTVRCNNGVRFTVEFNKGPKEGQQ